jgi:hypothetical protein
LSPTSAPSTAWLVDSARWFKRSPYGHLRALRARQVQREVDEARRAGHPPRMSSPRHTPPNPGVSPMDVAQKLPVALSSDARAALREGEFDQDELLVWKGRRWALVAVFDGKRCSVALEEIQTT